MKPTGARDLKRDEDYDNFKQQLGAAAPAAGRPKTKSESRVRGTGADKLSARDK